MERPKNKDPSHPSLKGNCLKGNASLREGLRDLQKSGKTPKKVGKNDITLSTAFAECEVLGEAARGKMVTDKLSEVDDYWKNRNIVVDKCMISKGFKLK